MTGSIRIAYMPPLCHLKIGCEVFPVKPPWFIAKIYPFVGFDPSLEFCPKSTIPITTTYVHLRYSLEIPLVELLPL